MLEVSRYLSFLLLLTTLVLSSCNKLFGPKDEADDNTIATFELQEDQTKTFTLSRTGRSGAAAFAITEQALHGNVTGGTNNSFTYTPNRNFNGSDSVLFTITPPGEKPEKGKVIFVVRPVKDSPTTTTQTIAVLGDSINFPLSLTATDVDGDAITYQILTQPNKGTVTLIDGLPVFTPHIGLTGPTPFTYRVSDGTLTSNTSTVTLEINNPPFQLAADSFLSQSSAPPYLKNSFSLSEDGNRIAFVSPTVNGVTYSKNQLAVYDVVSATTTLVLESPTDEDILETTLSNDGRFLAFTTAAPLVNQISNPSGTAQVYLYDFTNRSVALVSTDSSGTAANADCRYPILSAGGRYLLFLSSSTNLIASFSGNSYRQLFWKDLQTGQVKLASSTTANALAQRSTPDSLTSPIVESAQVSSDGRMVVFKSDATNFVTALNLPTGTQAHQIYLKNLDTAALVLVSGTVTSPANGPCYYVDMTDNASSAVFNCQATNLAGTVPSGLNYALVFQKNLNSGSITLVSQKSDGSVANADCSRPQLANDSSYVTYLSAATNLVSSNTTTSLFRVDVRNLDTVKALNKNGSGDFSDRAIFYPQYSKNGRRLLFVTDASNLLSQLATQTWKLIVR